MESEMKCNVSKMMTPQMPKGLDLEISHHPLTMRQVVNLIVAMERFKDITSESVLSSDFSDDNLLNIVLENIVEEQIVFECGSVPQVQIKWTGEEVCSVTDGEKRSLVRVQNDMELHAVMLQGGAAGTKNVFLNMSTYLHPASSVEGRTVALGIKDTNLYLSCRMEGGVPTLHLEAVENTSLLTGMGVSINPDSDLVRFLFYRQDTGLNISTLMSVAHQGWYISTAVQNNKPVEMCQESAKRFRTFSMC